MLLKRGQRVKLTDLTAATSFIVGLSVEAPANMVFDASCFGVDAQDKLSDDRYFIFYNQKSSPDNSVTSLGPADTDMERFEIKINDLPSTIRKLVFTLSLDGSGTMSQLKNGSLRFWVAGQEVAQFSFTGADFNQEKAIIVGELYFKDMWRFSAVGQGFDGGLSDLLTHFGGEEISSEPEPVQGAKAVPLEQPLAQSAPQLVDLSKKLAVTLEKKQLQNVVAKVVLVMDASNSMLRAYSNGSVQAVLERLVLVAASLDDDGKLETWFYASKHAKFPAVSVENVTSYLRTQLEPNTGWFDWGIIGGLGTGNNEPPVMREVVASFKSSRLPVFVIFITDGGICATEEIKQILVESSAYPLFWQFVGLAGLGYGILKELDQMTGRVVDNANFFQVDDLAKIDDTELYNRLLNEFPVWLKAAKNRGII